MSKIDRTQAPYYDYGESELAKQYYQLLAIPGRVAQAREISTLQTILQGIIKSIGDSIMSNGNIIEGCQVIVASDKKSVTITSGKIYIDGIVTPLSETTVSIKGVGAEVIGVKIDESIVTEEVDTSLRDPAQGYDNFSQAGCNRVRRNLIVVVDDPEASSIANLYDGELTVETYKPNYDMFEKTLARRTYDESGSYIVNGLSVHVEPKNSDSYNVVVEAGKAYVLGYELKIPTARRLPNPRSTAKSLVSVSNYVYSTGTDTYQLDNNPYVQSIQNVKGRVQITEAQVLTTNVDSVLLEKTDVVEIISISQGGTTYTKGSTPSDGDYYLMRDGTRYYVKWNGNSAPIAGQSYSVVYTYNLNFEQDVDYELVVDSTGSYLKFKSGGSTPLNGTNFNVDYYQYLARRDLLYLDQYGNFTIINGSPDEDGFEVTPVAPVNTLAIATIYNPPNGSPNSSISSLNVQVNNIGLTRFTMNDIQNIVNRVKRTEYNQAVLSLNDDARSRTTINSKKGILTDPLVDFSRIDLYYNLDAEGSKIDSSKSVYNMAVDLDNGLAYLPVDVSSYQITGTTSNTTKKYNRLVTLRTTGENTVLYQPNATKTFLINPYSVFPQLPEVLVTPAVDSWVEDNIIQVPISLTNTNIVNTTTKILYNTVYRRTVRGGYFSAYTVTEQGGTSTSYKDTEVGTTVSTSTDESVISEKAITYMRQIELTVEGKNFPPNLDNIKCTFDGVDVTLTPVSPTISGTISGSLKADADGYVKGKFTIPANIRTGIREVKLYSTIEVDGYKNSAYTIFQSSGTTRTIQRTLTTVTTVLIQREITNTINQVEHTYVDPVGQTFVLDRLTVLKGVDIYFENKPTTNQSVILEVRNVVNGTIGTTIFARKTLNASEVSVSNNATMPTRFNFDDPIVLEKDTEYAFTVRSLSDKYRIWVSEIGGTDVTTGDVILKNSYLTGVMMSSSNNSAWTIHQTMDIKFKLIEDVYEDSGTIVFSPITVNDCTRLDLLADSVELSGTSIKWYYSINGGATFYSISPGSLRELNSIANEVILKADFNRTSSENITPILAYDSILLVGSSYETSGEYIGVNVNGVDAYKNVTLIFNTYIPAGTSLTPYMSHDNGTTLTKMTLDNSQTRTLNNGWRELVYKAVVPSNGTSTQCRLFIKATTNSTTYTPKFSAVKIIMD